MAFFDTTTDLLAAKDFTTHIPQSIHQTSENYDYVALYDQWRNGGLSLPCLSIRNQAVIHANGNVPSAKILTVYLATFTINRSTASGTTPPPVAFSVSLAKHAMAVG